MNETNKILNNNEKILWQGGPKFLPFFFSGSIFITIFALFWTGFTLIFIITWMSTADGPMKYAILAMPHLWIGLAMLFGPSIYKLLVFKHTYYAITDKRVIFQNGIIARNFTTLDFDKITSASVSIGLFDRIFGGTGSILLLSPSAIISENYSKQSYTRISNVSNPYDVFKYFQKVSYDVKTDIEYPNAMRPDNNPGYKTEYNQPDVDSSKK